MSAKLQVGATLVDPASWRPKKSQFFIEDAELVILKVEDTLFKVHRFFLQRDSEVFHGMFSCPPGKGGAEGKTEARPIVLEQVTVFEFECLIDFIYNGMYHSTPAERTSKQWIALLSISSRYLFDKIRMQSIRALQSMASGIDAVERIVLSQQFDIQDWLKPALVDICVRQEAMSDVEGHRVGLRLSLQIARIRERLQRQQREGLTRAGWCIQCHSHQTHWSNGDCMKCSTPQFYRERAKSLIEQEIFGRAS